MHSLDCIAYSATLLSLQKKNNIECQDKNQSMSSNSSLHLFRGKKEVLQTGHPKIHNSSCLPSKETLLRYLSTVFPLLNGSGRPVCERKKTKALHGTTCACHYFFLFFPLQRERCAATKRLNVIPLPPFTVDRQKP